MSDKAVVREIKSPSSVHVSLKRVFLKRVVFSMVLPCIVYFGLGLLRPDVYLKWNTFIMLFTQTLANILVGWAMLFGMSVGLFDFSVGARVVLSGLFGIQMSQHFGVAGFIVGCFVSSIALSYITAAIYAALKIPSIITGFAVLLICESIATIYQKTFKVIVTTELKTFGVAPGIYFVVLAAFVLVYILFNHTKFGYQIKAIGGNEAVAKSMGIKATLLKLNTYVIGGVFLAFATIVKVGYAGTMAAQTNMGTMSQAFTPMMGVMIGMFISSCNMVIGSLIGTFSIMTVSSGLVAMGMDSKLQNVVIGLYLLIFIGIKSNSEVLKKIFGRRKEELQ
jgi:ribose transport system permease protein